MSVWQMPYFSLMIQQSFDLCKLNDSPTSNMFDIFWDELGSYTEELTPAVDDR